MLRNLGMITAVAALALTQQACANGGTTASPEPVGTSAAPAPSKTEKTPEKTATSKAAEPKGPILTGKR